ncbi:hypothetical protein AN218_02690, partial [Streptomyces nanshensis]
VAAGHDGLAEGLAAVAAGNSAPHVLHGEALRTGRTAFVFSGQGSQR